MVATGFLRRLFRLLYQAHRHTQTAPTPPGPALRKPHITPSGRVQVSHPPNHNGTDSGMAAYLSWVALLAVECRRVMGETVWETVQKYPIIGEQVANDPSAGADRQQIGGGSKGL